MYFSLLFIWNQKKNHDVKGQRKSSVLNGKAFIMLLKLHRFTFCHLCSLLLFSYTPLQWRLWTYWIRKSIFLSFSLSQIHNLKWWGAQKKVQTFCIWWLVIVSWSFRKLPNLSVERAWLESGVFICFLFSILDSTVNNLSRVITSVKKLSNTFTIY